MHSKKKKKKKYVMARYTADYQFSVSELPHSVYIIFRDIINFINKHYTPCAYIINSITSK